MFGAVHRGEGKAGGGGGSMTQVMDAEAAPDGGWPHTQCHSKHIKCLSVSPCSPHAPHPLCHSLWKWSTQISLKKMLIYLCTGVPIVFKLLLLSWQNKRKIQLPSSFKWNNVEFRSMKSGTFRLIKTFSKISPHCRFVPEKHYITVYFQKMNKF